MDLKHIEVKMARATTLPVFPNVVFQVLRLTDNPNASTREYERLIAQDAALTSKILRTANTPYFGGGGRITSLQRALSLLGMSHLRSICMTVAFQSALQFRGLHPKFRAAEFWQHSLAVACGTKILACLNQYPQSEEAFIAGLLHDIGKLALCIFLPQEAGTILEAMAQRSISQYECELYYLDVTHQEIGRMAAERWGLPQMFHDPIAHHHNPTDNGFEIDPLTACVHVANALTHQVGLGFEPSGMAHEADPMVKDFLAFSEGQYNTIRVAIANEVSRLSLSMGV
jgi:putative nucleotidyltransferase with HDIG domain